MVGGVCSPSFSLLTCSSPDFAFHAPPWRSACGPGPASLSRDTVVVNQDKEKALNDSGER